MNPVYFIYARPPYCFQQCLVVFIYKFYMLFVHLFSKYFIVMLFQMVLLFSNFNF